MRHSALTAFELVKRFKHLACLVTASVILCSFMPVAPVSAQGKYDNLQALGRQLPPGILHSRDRAIRILYAQAVAGLWDDFGRFGYRLRGEINGYYDSVLVQSESKEIEPALYVLVYMLPAMNQREHYSSGFGWYYTYVDPRYPKPSSPQMAAFADGVHRWHRLWEVDKRGTSYWYDDRWELAANGQDEAKEVEASLVRAITYAAFVEKVHFETERDRCARRVGDSCLDYVPTLDVETAEAVATEYLESDWSERESVLRRVAERFQELGNGDRGSSDPNDPYNKQLVAAWASYFLGLHYTRSARYVSDSFYADRHMWVTNYISIPAIDAIGYNIQPFKGQPLYEEGVKTRDNAGYTEQRYFELQERGLGSPLTATNFAEWGAAVEEELTRRGDRLDSLGTVNNEVPATRQERIASFRMLAPETFVRVATVPKSHVGDFKSDHELFGDVAITFTKDPYSDEIYYKPAKDPFSNFWVKGLLSVDGQDLGVATEAYLGRYYVCCDEDTENLKHQKFQMRWENRGDEKLRVQCGPDECGVLVRKRDLRAN